MANVRRIQQLSPWREYELVTDLLDPPVLKVRLRPLDAYDWMAQAKPGEEYGRAKSVIDGAMMAVMEWDLMENDQPIPVNEQTKREILRPLLGEPVKAPEGEKSLLLALVIFLDAQNRELFLKN